MVSHPELGPDPPIRSNRESGHDSPGQQRRSIVSEIINRPTTTTPAQAYAMRAREDKDAPGVIAGNFTLYDNEMHTLIDRGSTHSYICIEQLSDKWPLVEPLAYDMHVTSPLGHSVRVNRVDKKCPLMVYDREFSVDLIALPFHEFDLILGMDWLSKHRAMVDCDKKTILLKYSDLSQITVHGMPSNSMSNVIFTMQAWRFLRKGCETFLAVILDSKRGQVNLEDMTTLLIW